MSVTVSVSAMAVKAADISIATSPPPFTFSVNRFMAVATAEVPSDASTEDMSRVLSANCPNCLTGVKSNWVVPAAKIVLALLTELAMPDAAVMKVPLNVTLEPEAETTLKPQASLLSFTAVTARAFAP